MEFVEQTLLTGLNRLLKDTLPDKKVWLGNDNVNAQAQFPFISVVQTDTYTTKSVIDLSGNELGEDITITVDVYSNKIKGAKEECIELLDLVHQYMQSKNFTCITTTNMPNLSNNSIHRYVAKYNGRIVNKYFARR